MYGYVRYVGTSVRRYVVVVDVDAGVDLCDLLPGGWLSARLDSTRLDSSVRGTLGVDCVYSGVLCCAVLCASTTLLLLRSVVVVVVVDDVVGVAS